MNEQRTITTRKEVQQLDIITGEVINTFNSVAEATKTTNILHIADVCRGDRNSSGGFDWKYTNQDKLKNNDLSVKNEKSKKTSTKKINQIDPITNVVINTFNSINKAETSLKIYHIKRACDGQTKMAGGFKWEYAN